MEKTNVMRILDQKKIAYRAHFYDNSAVNGIEIADMLGENPQQVFKTLVTVGNQEKIMFS